MTPSPILSQFFSPGRNAFSVERSEHRRDEARGPLQDARIVIVIIYSPKQHNK